MPKALRTLPTYHLASLETNVEGTFKRRTDRNPGRLFEVPTYHTYVGRCTFLNLAWKQTWKELSNGESTEVPVDFCEEPTYHTYVPRVVKLLQLDSSNFIGHVRTSWYNGRQQLLAIDTFLGHVTTSLLLRALKGPISPAQKRPGLLRGRQTRLGIWARLRIRPLQESPGPLWGK